MRFLQGTGAAVSLEVGAELAIDHVKIFRRWLKAQNELRLIRATGDEASKCLYIHQQLLKWKGAIDLHHIASLWYPGIGPPNFQSPAEHYSPAQKDTFARL